MKTAENDIVNDIIRFNNSQNRVTAADFRSTDSIQKRLREEVAQIPDVEYQGGRRGGHADAIRRLPKLMPSYTVGQALAALHGDPVVAYNQKTEIWVTDKLYSKYFNDETTGPHLVLAYSLLRAVEAKKLGLVEKSRRNESSLTQEEQKQLQFFRQRGSTYLLAAAIAGCLETFLDRRISNRFRISFGRVIGPKTAQQEWAKVVDRTAPFCICLEEALKTGLKSVEKVNTAIQTFQSLVVSTKEANAPAYKAFASRIARPR